MYALVHRVRDRLNKSPRLKAALSVALIVGAGALWYFWWVPPAHTFYLRSDGWHPGSVAVEPGESVTFVNKSRHAFWPASNGHPQHDQYTEFDAGHPIEPGESWTFTFDREGAWGFHDHIRSYYTGTVYVGAAALTYNCLDHLSDLDIGKKRECWDEKLSDTLRTKGATAAFTEFAQFYASDPDFSKIGCHIIAHALGDVAYGEYVRYGNDLSKLQFPPETVYCGYGYYHGILEHMIRDHPDFAKADNFCKDLIEKYEGTVPRIRENCYHAIGHGFIPEPTDVETWGNAHDLPAPAIAACRNLEDPGLRSECMQGAFNVVADWMWNNQFGLSMPKEDSLSLCRTFDDEEVMRACYYELSMKVLPFAGTDIREVYRKFAASIVDDEIAGMVVNSAAAGILGTIISQDSFIPLLWDCRALPTRVQVDCLKGITGGFVAHGEPEKEYVKAIAFCGSPVLTSAEKETCYFNIARTFKGAYSKEKVAEVCTLFEEPYRHYCDYES